LLFYLALNIIIPERYSLGCWIVSKTAISIESRQRY
jgi:hypothetical protein